MGLFKKKDLGKIYTTTDGYFADNKRNKKKRHVVVVDQRNMDGAIAVSKLHSQKDGQKGCIDNLVLSPKKHSALSTNTVVERRVIHGVKRDGQYKAIYKNDFSETKSRLNLFEFFRVKRGSGGRTRHEKNIYRKTRRKWHNGFKRK